MIRIHDVSFDYTDEQQQPRRVLQQINLYLSAGEFVAVMGANGSGKSTLARCLNGLLLPDQGWVEVEGMRTSDTSLLPAIRRRVGMLFQNPDNQIVSTTVEREIAFGLENIGMPVAEMRQRVEQALNRFHLQPYRRKSPHYLSGGEKQRLALAAVIAMDPCCLVLDEPTSLLDPAGRKEMLGLFRTWHDHPAQPRRTTILITQFPEEALTADRLIVLHHGQTAMDGAPTELLAQTERLEQMGLDSPILIKLQRLLGSHPKA